MTSPIDAVVAIHNAFRRDIATIDEAALGAAQGRPGIEGTVERFRFMNEALTWHANGEEAAMFPTLEQVAPLVAEAYVKDDPGLDAACDSLSNAVSARDALGTARATAACKFHLDVHLARRAPICTASSEITSRCATRQRPSWRRDGGRGAPGPLPGVRGVDVPAHG